jgi:hypothetical protein
MSCEGSLFSRTRPHQLPVSEPAAASPLASKLLCETPDSNCVFPRISLALDHFNSTLSSSYFRNTDFPGDLLQ